MNNDIYETTIIKNEDTVFNIGKKLNINPDLLALINGLNKDDYLYMNQKILIPKKEFSYYFTKSGDNLNDILDLFGNNYDTFIKINRTILLEDGQIFANKR